MTDVIALARAGKIRPPGNPAFDIADWNSAAADHCEDPERSLLTSVAWFDEQLRAAKEPIADLRLRAVDRERLLRELCGLSNYAYAYSEASLNAAMEVAEPGSLPMRSMAHLLFRTETDMPYGDRQGGVRDRSGNIWWISQHLSAAHYFSCPHLHAWPLDPVRPFSTSRRRSPFWCGRLSGSRLGRQHHFVSGRDHAGGLTPAR